MNLEKCFPDQPNQSMAYTFPNVGVVLDRLPNKLYNDLMKDIKIIQTNFEDHEKYNHKLVGHIQKQFSMKSSIPLLNDYVVDLAIKHQNCFEMRYLQEVSNSQEYAAEFRLESLWVNFQKKYEFNPPHIHTGVYSFVIWMKIPYDIEEEKKLFLDTSKEDNCPSNFNFYFSDILGKTHDQTVHIDKEKEGCICLFPSTLTHSVNPFYTSDDYRISISGNVYLRLKLK